MPEKIFQVEKKNDEPTYTSEEIILLFVDCGLSRKQLASIRRKRRDPDLLATAYLWLGKITSSARK